MLGALVDRLTRQVAILESPASVWAAHQDVGIPNHRIHNWAPLPFMDPASVAFDGSSVAVNLDVHIRDRVVAVEPTGAVLGRSRPVGRTKEPPLERRAAFEAAAFSAGVEALD